MVSNFQRKRNINKPRAQPISSNQPWWACPSAEEQVVVASCHWYAQWPCIWWWLRQTHVCVCAECGSLTRWAAMPPHVPRPPPDHASLASSRNSAGAQEAPARPCGSAMSEMVASNPSARAPASTYAGEKRTEWAYNKWTSKFVCNSCLIRNKWNLIAEQILPNCICSVKQRSMTTPMRPNSVVSIPIISA
jgi:hypothetical protein